MGHRISSAESLFTDVKYKTKSTEELRDAMTAKVASLKEKMAERQTRMLRIREEYAINAERLAVLVMRFSDRRGNVSYDDQGEGPVVPAGVIQNLISEQEMSDSERKQISKLELVLRNLQATTAYVHPQTGEFVMNPSIHELDDEELIYLGF